jgi:hypothetical protein
MPRVVGKSVRPPEGWVFEPTGHLAPDVNAGGFNETTFDTLYVWAKEKQYGLTPQFAAPFYQDGWIIACRYTVTTDAWETTEKWLGDGKWQPRQTRAERVSLGIYNFMGSNGIAYLNRCSWCETTGLNSHFVGGRDSKQRFCANCCKPCTGEGCSGYISIHAQVADEKDKCTICCPRKRCKYCRRYHAEAGMLVGADGKYVCKECEAEYRCTECAAFSDQVFPQDDGTRLCGSCQGARIDAERIPHEKWDEGELPKGGSLRLAALVNRPVRVISIETEVDGDAHALANTLYNAGYIREGFVESYSTKCPDTSSWPAFLKHDGSVTGGELIHYLMQFDKAEHANSVKEILAKLRSLQKVGKVEYNANCGGHIHIDAHNFSTDNIWRLVTGYNYLEDVIFRLAGAGCSYGHRTLVAGHDRANNGRGYSHPTAKGPWGVKSNAFRACMGQDRMTGLNFKPYQNAVEYCACGAGADNLRNCTCVLPKCTIEWRVWNSTGNPRILHGWLAFMQSLHAWADTPKEMTNVEEDAYPTFGWTKKKWQETGLGHRKVALERVRWIFEKLVFSANEKDSLLYAFGETDIEFPDGFLDELREIPSPRNRTVVAPRNTCIRATKLAVKQPDRKVFGNVLNDPLYVRGAPERRYLNAAERLADQAYRNAAGRR